MKRPHAPKLVVAVPFLLASLLPLLLLTACQGTLHTRWDTTGESYKEWQPKMASIPIEVHGAVPGSDSKLTMANIPGATDAETYDAQQPDGPPLRAMRRIVLYIGGNQLPTDRTYCQPAPKLRTAVVAGGMVMFASALCDGARLVVTARREVAPKDSGASTMAHTIQRIKDFMLYGVASSRAQPALKFRCTSDKAGEC